LKKITRLVHTFSKLLSFDSIASKYGYMTLLRKFVPEPIEYKKPTIKYVKRNGVNFRLDVSDFMQWSIYASVPDSSYKYALNTLKRYADPVQVIDVGANVGAFCFSLAHECQILGLDNINIYAFEPNPFIFKSLKSNARINPDLAKMISFESYALGDAVRTANFTFSAENSGNGHIIVGNDLNSFEVKMTTCDTFLAQQKQLPVAFIKIDVEGFEPFVIDGALSTIERCKPDLYIEITPNWYQERGRSVKLTFEYLLDMGYFISIDYEGVLKPIKSFDGNYPRQFNILASCCDIYFKL
jgi:FkbM family methyltransferase